jgi:hypothetical protein
MPLDTKELQKKKKRLNRLNELWTIYIGIKAKFHAAAVVKEFRIGLRRNSFGLKELKERTIKAKEAAGYSKPKNPLYGAGDSKDNSYLNMFFIRAVKGGYKIMLRWAKHWKAQIPLKILFKIHEYGAVIRQHTSAGKEVLIRIPPRPALRHAQQKFLFGRENKNPMQEFNKATLPYVLKADIGPFKKLIDSYDEKIKKYLKA